MSKAKITLLGFYKWDDTLFEELTLPDGIDKQTIIDDILVKGADFEVIYSDYDFTKEMIGLISRKWRRTFQKWYDALQLEYNPIYNYDRFEEWTDKGTDTGTIDNDGTAKTTTQAEAQTDTYVTTYDSDSLHQDGRSHDNENGSSNGETNNTETRDLATSGEHEGHLYGNIGVTTSQQMLESELELAEWNLYEHITDIFIKELCIMVY